MSGRNVRNRKRTTVWDFLISLGSGLTNLLKIEKIICLIFLYLLGRDLYFTVNLDKGEIYRENIIDAASIFKLLIENDSYKDMIYIAIIVILAIVVLIMIIIINKVYIKEINRLSRERSRLIHDIRSGEYTPLKKHYSSRKDGD